MKKMPCVFVVVLFLFVLLASFHHVMLYTTAIGYDPVHKGLVREQDTVTILYQSGSCYEMGYQHGSLLKEEIEENYRAFLSRADDELYASILDRFNTHIKKNIPSQYIDEMQGLADGAEMSFADVAVVNTGWYLIIDIACAEMSAWGAATQDGRLYHVRSWDIPFDIYDPQSGSYVVENQVLVVRTPLSGYASVYVCLAGFIENIGGCNDQGLCVSYDMSSTIDNAIEATPWSLRQKMVLDYASDIDEAVSILSTNRTGGFNFIVSDGDIPTARVCEFTAHFSYIGTWNDPVESNYPFWSIENVVRRKNFFLNRTTAGTQRFPYNPRRVVHMLNPNSVHFLNWKTYKELSIEIEQQWGGLTLNNTIEILQKVYCGKTDLFLFVSVHLFGGLQAYHQWVCCPETGDFLISFGEKDRQAQFVTPTQFNLFDLLEEFS
jgi:hypothetical protein